MNKLRFKGHAEPWEQRKLGEVATFSRGKGLPKSELSKDGTVPCVHYGELFASPVDFEPVNRTNATKDKNYSIAGDILMPSSDVTKDGLAKASVVKESGVILGGDINIVRLEEGNDSIFWAHQIKHYKREIIKKVTGTAVKHFYTKELAKIEYCQPSLPEQEKIGGFLSALDERLRIQSELVDLLVLEYTGYSQRIFSQKLRFKDQNGKNYPDWEQKKLGEVASSFSSNIAFSLLTEKSELFSTPVYTAKGIEGYVDKPGNPDAYVAVLKDGAGIGRVTYCEPGSLFISTLQGIKPNDGMDVRFMKELLVRMNLAKYKVGSGIPHVYFKEYSLAEVSIPSLPEQEKIGGFLSALSARIEAERALLDQYKEQKKAYLQKLLP